jgi:hypothetical protein
VFAYSYDINPLRGAFKNKRKQKKQIKTIGGEPCIIAAPYQGALNVFFCFVKDAKAYD